jgi:hypothetical protein
LYGIAWSAEYRALRYLQRGGPDLLTARSPAEWGRIYAVYEVPVGTASLTLRLSLAARADIPSNGSAGRFDDLGVFLFPTAAAANQFALSYQRGR